MCTTWLGRFVNSPDQKLRVLLVGRHELACQILETLHKNTKIDLACLPARREDADRRPALARLAALKTVPILGGDTKSALSDAIDQVAPHLMISAGYDRIVPADLLARVERSVNVHFGMLPKYRGSYSIPWAILNNETEIGVTLHEMAPSIDDGAIIRQDRFLNDPVLSCRDIYDRAVEIGSGFVTWLVWVFLHLMSLPQLQNRMRVQTEWLLAYYTGQRSSRLIPEAPRPEQEPGN